MGGLRILLLVIVLAGLTCQPAQALTLLVIGDSLSAGLGVEREEAYPYLVAEELRTGGIEDLKLINGGISGSTSANGPISLKWYARAKPDLLILALGANDGLRGLPIEQMRSNLATVIREARDQGVFVILAGMEIPPNYGHAYTTAFRAVYPSLAAEYEIPLIPFLLEGVAGDPRYNQADGIHPNAEGHRRIARTVLPFVRQGLELAREGKQASDAMDKDDAP